MKKFINTYTGGIVESETALSEEFIELSEKQYQEILPYLKDGYLIEVKKRNNVLEFSYVTHRERRKNIKLRQTRSTILQAFDKYKTNVVYGILDETPETKQKITKWYKSMLNLEPEAFKDENIPEEIKYYL